MHETTLQWKKVYLDMHNKPSQVLLPVEAFLFVLGTDREKALLLL